MFVLDWSYRINLTAFGTKKPQSGLLGEMRKD